MQGVATLPVDSTPLEEGETKIVVVAPENKSMDKVAIPIVKKTTEPLVEIASTVSAGFINQSNQNGFLVKGTCSEIGKEVVITIRSSNGAHVKKTTLCSNSKSFELKLSTEVLPDGSLEIITRHYDDVGNFVEDSILKEKDTINNVAAILSFEPNGASSLTYLKSSISGSELSGYIYKVGPEATTNCSILSGYSNSLPLSQELSANLTPFGNGPLKLCILTIDEAGNTQPLTDASVINWTRDTTIINSVISEFTPAGHLSNQAGTRTLEVSGENLTEYKYEIIHSGSCTDVDFSNLPSHSISTPISFNASTDNTYQVCIIAKNEAGHWQPTPTGPAPFRLDQTPPTPTLSYTGGAPLNTSPMVFSIVFNEVVVGFDSSDLSIVNGTVQSFSGSGSSYTFSVLPTAQGNVSVNVAANSSQDLAGNSSLASNTITRNFDSVPPTVLISSIVNSSTNQTSIPVNITFSKPVSGFIASDLVVVNGSVNSFNGSGANYTLNLVPASQGAVSIQLPSGVAIDASGNLNTSANFSRIYETVPPTVTLSTLAGVAFTSSPLTVVAQFSEEITGFAVADLNLTNATATISGSGSTYTIALTPLAQGEVSVSIKASSFSDIAGNINTAVSNTITSIFDSLPPTAVLSTLAATHTKASSVLVTATMSEEITGLAASDLTLVNATATVSGSMDTYSITLTPLSEGAFSVRLNANTIEDLSGLKNTSASNLLSFNYDTTSPSVAISSVALPYVKAAFNVTITFSEAVTGFVVGDLYLVNGVASGFSGSGTTYTVTITPSAQGTVGVAVPINRASDAAGNENTASNNFTRIFDNTPPSAPSISINANATYTTSSSVTLTLSALDSPTEMSLSHTAGCSGGTWEPYATSKPGLLLLLIPLPMSM